MASRRLPKASLWFLICAIISHTSHRDFALEIYSFRILVKEMFTIPLRIVYRRSNYHHD